MSKKKSEKLAVAELFEQRLKNRWRKAPFVLRLTEWADYPGTVVVIKERLEREQTAEDDSTRKSHSLKDRGYIYGENLKRLTPVLRRMLEPVCDEAGIPLDLQRFFTQEGLQLRDNLPLDEESGAKLALLFRLQERVTNPDRVELMARRIMRFSREEAAYWLSRTTSFSADANRWAITGLRIMLAGHGNQDAGIERMLEKLR